MGCENEQSYMRSSTWVGTNLGFLSYLLVHQCHIVVYSHKYTCSGMATSEHGTQNKHHCLDATVQVVLVLQYIFSALREIEKADAVQGSSH